MGYSSVRGRRLEHNERNTKSATITPDQIVEAASELGRPEFTRGEVAEKLGVKTTELKQGFKAAREDGRLEKVRDDDSGTGIFKVTS